MASHALGAVQDVVADREGGLSSIATGLGARLATRLACGGYAIAAVLCFALPFPGWIVGGLGLGYAVNALRFANVTDETSADVNRAWRVFLLLNVATGGVITVSVLFFLFPPAL